MVIAARHRRESATTAYVRLVARYGPNSETGLRLGTDGRMYHRDLPSRWISQQTEKAMPLPHFVSRCAFFHALIVISLLGVCMPHASASHEQLACNPRSMGFGKVVIGQSQNQRATLTNTGSSSITVTQASASVAAFIVENLELPVTLAAGQSANFSITFAPTTAGNVSGAVTFTSNASNSTLTVKVSGRGVNDWALQANPASLAFGTVQVGSSSTLPMTIINAGSSSESISMGQVGGPGYSVSGVTLPLTWKLGKASHLM